MDRLRCIVERITYQNDQNGYSVIKCKAKGYNDLVTVVGAMPEVHVGAVLTLTGMWKWDMRYAASSEAAFCFAISQEGCSENGETV